MARVLITGCSSGIGRAVAQELAARGHDVIATARRVEDLDDLPVAERLALDVVDDASIRSAVAAAGTVDVLVNNAGRLIWGAVEHLPLDATRQVFETNVFGPVNLVQEVLPQMRARRSGRIVNVSSIAGPLAVPLGGAYSASKRALEAFTEALRLEVGHLGIAVSVVLPPSAESKLGGNSVRVPTRAPEYDVLGKGGAKLAAHLRSLAPAMTAAEVGRELADIVEAERPALTYVLTATAQQRIAERRAMSDGDYETMLRAWMEIPTAD